ncbi:putative glycosyltransferase [Cylindrospermum stagnale PCC 7417]|uniref:Putative glycosyltransferase n=1 Tax=Cylindrospermum stagnale PCC 7417 TaxID=56107 RepID=K9WRF5_9NOST|nr:glycosyltransferase [Cylindrospermum stagnale]AFZ22783.1 putative glycosyltransferase [Cylindrospermum stagnale PCC 7417]
MPKISVVIPAYNAMAYLPKTVDSVLKQTFNDFELLIIDDGSSDQIVEWISQITDSRVKLISQKNQGLSGARNTGIAHAQGEYIAFLDADDLWAPTKLEKQVRCLDEQPKVGVVYTWTLLVDEQDKPTGRIFANHAEGNIWQQLLENDVISSGSSAMVRRCCFETVGVFDCNLNSAEDLDMWLRIADSYPFAVVKELLTLYRQHPNSMSKNRQRMFQSLRTVFEKAFQSVPLNLLYLRNRAYASMFLGLAWLAIDDKDYKKAIDFRKQALLHHQPVRFSERCMRLNLAIAMIRWFGRDGYDGLRTVSRAVRRHPLFLKT